MKIHLLDADKAHGVRCNNPSSVGHATSDPENVTCISCKPDQRRSRWAGSVARDDTTRVPPGPAGGD